MGNRYCNKSVGNYETYNINQFTHDYQPCSQILSSFLLGIIEITEKFPNIPNSHLLYKVIVLTGIYRTTCNAFKVKDPVSMLIQTAEILPAKTVSE